MNVYRNRPTSRYLQGLIWVLSASCIAPGTPSIDGVPGAPPRPDTPWAAPAPALTPLAEARAAQLPPNLGQQLTIADVVNVALRNNPATQISWAQALSAADLYGQSRSTLYPTANATVNATEANSANANAKTSSGARIDYGPTATLSYLLLDFGGRSGTIDVARQTAIAADLTHNATIGNTILQVETSAFTYIESRALRDAQRLAVTLAQTALDAANARHNVGVATVADVLQAQTALSQAVLQLETLQGNLDVARGSLAAAMGLQANARFDIPDPSASTDTTVHFVTDSVDAFIAEAVRARPELAAARAQGAAAASQIRAARAAALPSLGFTATGTKTNSTAAGLASQNYSLALGLQIPIFNGFGRDYGIRNAQDLLIAANARTEQTRQQVELQVFTSYYSLRTATDRVQTSETLLASATESEAVARGRYQEGVGSIVDLLTAQSALETARAEEVDARWVWRSSLAQLAHDMGTLTMRGEPLLQLPAGR